MRASAPAAARAGALLVAVATALALFAAPAAAQPEGCRRAVIFALPGVRWEDVRAFRPEALGRAAEMGAVGSVSVRTVASRTSYASGFATIGAGARVDGGRNTGGPVGLPRSDGLFAEDVAVAGVPEIVELAEEAGYGAVPGALAGALPASREVIAVGNADIGLPVPLPAGYGRYTLLAAMGPDGVVELAATGSELLAPAPAWPFDVRTDAEAARAALDAALARPCASLVVDQGDLIRADRLAAIEQEALPGVRRRALAAADALLAHLLESLDLSRDLLLLVSPTSPAWLPETHLGVAVALGPGFPPGSTLVSASTRRPGIVTLPDVAPTVLRHAGVERPPSMTGRRWAAVESGRDAVDAAVELNRETVFVDRVKSAISTAFVVFQIAIYLVALALLASWERRRRVGGAAPARNLQLAGLAIVAFPLATFVAGAVPAHRLGAPLYVALLLALDAAIVAGAAAVAARPLDRLLAVAAATLVVLGADLLTGSRLQINTVFGYSPVVAGRFAGAGNVAFSVLGATAVVAASLLVQRLRGGRGLAAAGALFAAVVVVDGAPQFGSDVGGVLAFVPGFGITWLLLAGIRPSLRLAAAAAAATVAALALFLAVDLARAPESRTHLGQLFERVREGGAEVLLETIGRKAEANLRVFRSSIYTFFVPPALAVMAWLVMQPRGRWRRLAGVYPRLRAGLIGGLVVGVLGFAVNDSGIVIPAVVLSFLVPMALMLHLALELGEPA